MHHVGPCIGTTPFTALTHSAASVNLSDVGLVGQAAIRAADLVVKHGGRHIMDVYFVGWGGLALINAALANIDRRGPLKYFLGSLLVGPIVTVILAATREADDGGLRQVDLWKGQK